MTKDELIALADRIEALSGPDREIDAEIALALGIVSERDGSIFYGHRDYSVMVLERGYYDIDGSAPELPHYTASLDAALTLTPDGWFLRVEPRFYSDEGQVRWRAYAIKPDWSRWTPHDDWFEVVGEDDMIVAAKAPLALTAAAIRAHATTLGD